MKDRILSALRTKYASFGLSREALDRVASQKVKTITSDEEIEDGISDVETMTLVAKELQGSADSLRTRNTQLQRELEDLKKEDPDVHAGGSAEKFAEIEKKQNEILEKFAEREKADKRAEVMEELHRKLKAMGCGNDFIRKTTLAGIEIADGDTADSLAERLKPVYDANCKEAYGDGYRPLMGNGGGSDEGPDFSAMVEALRKDGSLPAKKE